MPRYVQKHRPPDDRNPLQGLLDYENLDGTIREAGEDIRNRINEVRDGIIEWIRDTTGIDLTGIAEFGDAVFDAIAQALHVPSGSEVMQLLQGLLTLNPFDFINRLGELVGGDFDLGIPAIFGRLEDRLAGLRLDGGVDASKLFGELPQDIINFLRSVITAVFNPSWLSNLVTGQIGTGWSANLQTNPDFDGDVSVAPSPGVEHDATVYPPGGKGSVKMTADGTRKSTAGDTIEGSAGQSVRVGAKLRWAGVVRSTTGRAFTIEVSPYDSSGAELAPVVVTGINNPGASSGWQEIVADIPWPTGAVKLKPRLAVESFVTAGTVHWSAFQIRKGGALPQDRIKDLPADLGNLFGGVLGVGNAIAGYLTGAGTPTGGTGVPTVLDLVRDALDFFTGKTNTTATTADVANGVGGNALTNTVSIQTQVQGLVERQDNGVSARTLHETMDYTADGTFPLSEIQSYSGSHQHAVASGSVSVNSYSGSSSSSFNGTTDSGNGGGGSHTHGYNNSVSINLSHGHSGSTFASHNTQQAGIDISPTPVQITATQAYFGYLRCRSVQEKRLFNFPAFTTGTVSTFNLDVYRVAADGALTLVYSSANFAGAITTVFDWVQHPLPSGAPSIDVEAGDILAIQLRMTGSGSVWVGGKVTPVPLNPPGWVPRRISAVRNPTGNPAPASISAAIANASHTSTSIPYIEAAIDTGMASAPLSLADNFNGALSQLWLMTGSNELAISSNNLGVVPSGGTGSTGISWGKFQKQVNTDQSKVGFTTTSPNGQQQIAWFHGSGPSNHVGLSITSSYATVYTMVGGSRTNRTQVAIGTAAATYELRYNAATKVFSAWRNGAQIMTWTDSGNVAPTGLGNRFGGVALEGTRGGFFGLSFDKANPIDDWLMADI